MLNVKLESYAGLGQVKLNLGLPLHPKWPPCTDDPTSKSQPSLLLLFSSPPIDIDDNITVSLLYL
jgi:hypothetical protein